jgi:hypothetical protein
VVTHPQAHRRAHGHVTANLGARRHVLRDRLQSRGDAAHEEEGRVRRARRQPHFLAFIAKAVADSLRKHPVVNAAVGQETTIYRRDINLGIAVALDWGLIVPVIKHADELSMLGLARSISDLADRARSKKLSPDEVQKGTFTITNPGVFGSTIGIPIINQPQVAILAGRLDHQAARGHDGGRGRYPRHPHQGHALALVRPPGRSMAPMPTGSWRT